MSNFVATSIKNLSSEGLYLLAKDAEQRIGSHVAGGITDENYVNQQRNILQLVQDELNIRFPQG
ncbi:hypothetical protein M3936_14080 [Sutcliffiella horikoshii]|uniref:hypothetical protein n=1 Tax=Sutcliffiella horikoshii TaxID=79883 RepID=UPI00203CEB22|nr:hypothetical protein [Sutcliffiella horikoshii]MCM3618715.1 hypothetical protein [Sutcliffiella horikoshii]